MNRWISNTTGLQSKLQLKSHRKDRWLGLLLQADLDPQLAPIWTDDEKAQAQQLFNSTLGEYNQMKAKLKQAINALSTGDREKYFNDIGIVAQNLDNWLG